MKPAPHHREVMDWLRGHGATRVRLANGGRHPRLEFQFRGREHRVPVAGSPSDVNSAHAKIRELRHALGDPVVPADNTGRRLDDMTAELNTRAASLRPALAGSSAETPCTGSVARYLRPGGGTPKLKFSLPLGDAQRFFGDAAIDVTTTPDGWLLRKKPDTRTPAFRPDGRQARLDASDPSTSDQAFGTTAATFVLLGNEVRVALAGEPQAVKAQQRRLEQKPVLTPQPEEVVPPPATAADEAARAALAAVRAVEATTPYRLVRRRPDDGSTEPVWSFVARID